MIDFFPKKNTIRDTLFLTTVDTIGNLVSYYFLIFSTMFKGKVYLSKKEGDKQEKIEREFDNEKDFDAFIDKNPDLKKLRDFKWETIRWPMLAGFDDFFKDLGRLGDQSVLEEAEMEMERMEKEMGKLFQKTRKLLK